MQSFASPRYKPCTPGEPSWEKKGRITIVWLGAFDSQKRLFPLSVLFAGDSVAKTAVYAIDGNVDVRMLPIFAHMVDANYILGWREGGGGWVALYSLSTFHLNILIIHFTCRVEAAYRVNPCTITEYVEHDFAPIAIHRLHLCVIK